jgi:phosphoadenosine phosphosulfate reductase
MPLSSKIDASLDLIRQFADHEYPGEICAVSSFGAEAAVLLHLVSLHDPAFPVRFIDTGQHFRETLLYRNRLANFLGLRDLVTLQPSVILLAEEDPDGMLHRRDPARCCRLRKVDPFAAIAERFRATFTGRKRHHGGERNLLPTVEVVDGLVRIHPLADWTADDMKRYMTTNSLPPHPLVAEGYASIGCAPCTDRVAEGEDVRAGRWRGNEKTECGIHLPSLGSTV